MLDSADTWPTLFAVSGALVVWCAVLVGILWRVSR